MADNAAILNGENSNKVTKNAKNGKKSEENDEKNWINRKSVDEEVRFYTYVQDSDSVLEGVIDLIVFKDDYNLIIDYKTDRTKNITDHKAQVVQYVKTASDIYKKPCYGTLFYLREREIEPFWDKDGNIIEL